MLEHESIVNIGDTALFCRMGGDGPPLVLLHGFFQSSAQWEPFFDELTREFRLIVPDLRGHGKSTNPTSVFTHRQSAMDIYALLDELGIQHFRAIGFSSGGMTLLHMATQQPERIEAMALFSTTSHYPEQARAIMRVTKIANARGEFLDMLRGVHVRGDTQIQALYSQFQQFAADYDDMNFTPARLSTITARTLIVHGDRDEFFPVSIPVELYDAIPGAGLWILPGGTHMNLIKLLARTTTGSQEFPALALAFLKEIYP